MGAALPLALRKAVHCHAVMSFNVLQVQLLQTCLIGDLLQTKLYDSWAYTGRACRLLCQEIMCCMRMILQNRLRNSAPKGTYCYHRQPPGRVWACMCESVCKAKCLVLVSRQRDLCWCGCSNLSDLYGRLQIYNSRKTEATTYLSWSPLLCTPSRMCFTSFSSSSGVLPHSRCTPSLLFLWC